MEYNLNVSANIRTLLACPQTHRPLVVREVTSADEAVLPIQRTGSAAPRFQRSGLMAVTEGGDYAYPIVDGFPALLWPEVYTRVAKPEQVDLNHRSYAEAYAEMEHYNPTSLDRAAHIEESDAYGTIAALLRERPPPSDFPAPLSLWLDALHDTGAQSDAYRYLAPLIGKTFVQLGGDGRHAVKLMLAGAAEGILITPMLGEAMFAWKLAKVAGVQNRFSCILGIGEQIPLLGESVHAMYSPGCLHHMALETALPEIRRVLTTGGRFCGHEPWKSPLYSVGTWLFGKREHGLFERSKSIFCQPFTPERIRPLAAVFPTHTCRNHGPLLRYPMIALQKFGIRLPLNSMIQLAKFDDRLGGALGMGDHWGGSIMLGGEKAP